MDELLLTRDEDGDVRLAGTDGAVSLDIIYDSVLGTGRQGVVFVGEISRKIDARLVMKVSKIAGQRMVSSLPSSRMTCRK